MTECQKLHPLLAGYLAEELTADERARVARHVNACAGCAQEVSAFASLEQTLAAAAEPRYRISATSDQGLQRAVQDEIRRSRGRIRFALRRAIRGQYIFVGVPTVAAMIALLLFMLKDPPPAEVLASSIATLRKCRTIHARGYAQGSYHDDWEQKGTHYHVRQSHEVPMEIWQTNRGRGWQRTGDDVIVINGNARIHRVPGPARFPVTRSTFDSSSIWAKGTIGAHLSTALKAVQLGAKTRMERHWGVLKIIVEERRTNNVATFVITLARNTKRLLLFSRSISDRSDSWRLESFEYDRPLPPEVAADIERLTKGPVEIDSTRRSAASGDRNGPPSASAP